MCDVFSDVGNSVTHPELTCMVGVICDPLVISYISLGFGPSHMLIEHVPMYKEERQHTVNL